MSEEKEVPLKFKTIEVGHGYVKNNIKYFTRNRYIDIGELNKFIIESDRTSCFCTNYRYDTGDVEHGLIYGNMYFDLDNENDFEQVRKDAIRVITYLEIVFKLKSDEYNIYFSGCKGLHITISPEVLGVKPTDNLNEIYKYIAKIANSYTPYKTIDMKIYDRKRLFRIPNTINEKTGLYKIYLSEDEMRNLSIEDIRTMAKQPRELKKICRTKNNQAEQAYEKIVNEYTIYSKRDTPKTTYKKTLTFVPPCIQNILVNGAEVGSRNITIACLASNYKLMCKSYEEACEIIAEWNSKNSSPTPEHELRRTIKSMYSSSKCFGCATLQTISTCSQNCPIYLNKQKKLSKDTDIKQKEERQKKLKELGIIQ